MPSRLASQISQKLFAQLAAAVGHQSASLELKWMQENSPSAATLAQMVTRRLHGEPLQYILGTQPFGPLELLVRPPVLIPRPETEDWTLRLAKLIRPSKARPVKLLDLCTGSGCIPLLLCHTWAPSSVEALGIDINDEALLLATDNAKHIGIPARNKFSVLQADILKGDLLSILNQRGLPPFDVLTSNPPYIPRSEYDELPSSVKDYEDSRALLGDPESKTGTADGRGLTFYHAIAHLIGPEGGLVKPGGLIALEVGRNQSEEVEDLMVRHARVQKIETWTDPWGVKRVVVARK